MKLELYEAGPTRSARCRWTLLELSLPFETAGGREMMGNPDFRPIHPLSKLPALVVDGRPMFESAAICTWLADAAPEKGLIAQTGTWERAMHEQWSYFALAEMEPHVWSITRNTRIYPEAQRVPAVLAQNEAEFRKAAGVLDAALAGRSYLVGDAFSVTDIIVAFAANWGRLLRLTGDCPNVESWLDRLYAREHCTLSKPKPKAA
ncbi:MAG: glutathione S-transferase family protein [Alphaproteobacteria bacterium]